MWQKYAWFAFSYNGIDAFLQKAWITSVQKNLSIGESSRPVNFQLLKNVLSDLVQ